MPARANGRRIAPTRRSKHGGIPMNQAEKNAETVRHTYEAFNAADLKTLDQHMTPGEITNLHRLAHRMRKKARLDSVPN